MRYKYRTDTDYWREPKLGPNERIVSEFVPPPGKHHYDPHRPILVFLIEEAIPFMLRDL